MAGRVLIQGGNNAAMLVSLPGFDVNSANIDQTCFDSRWSGLNPYRAGATLDATANGPTAVSSFGETLDLPPLFIGGFRNINSSGVPLSDYMTQPYFYRGGGTDYWWYVVTTTSNIQFQVFDNTGGSTFWRLYYTLFRRPAG